MTVVPFLYQKETKGQAWSSPSSFTVNIWNITELKTHFLCPFWYINLKATEQQFSKRAEGKKRGLMSMSINAYYFSFWSYQKENLGYKNLCCLHPIQCKRQCTSLMYESVLYPPTVSQTEGKCIIWCKSSEGNTNSPRGEITSSSICICQARLMTELWPQNNILISVYMLPLPKE